MNDADTKRLRLKHVEAMRMVAISEDLHERAEMMVAVLPLSPTACLSLWLSRLALRMARHIETDARAKARQTYDHWGE